MLKLPTDIVTKISHVLERAGITASQRRASMIKEVSQLIELRAWQIALFTLPEVTRKQIVSVPESEIARALAQHIPASTFTTAAAHAMKEIIPPYLAELGKHLHSVV